MTMTLGSIALLFCGPTQTTDDLYWSALPNRQQVSRSMCVSYHTIPYHLLQCINRQPRGWVTTPMPVQGRGQGEGDAGGLCFTGSLLSDELGNGRIDLFFREAIEGCLRFDTAF